MTGSLRGQQTRTLRSEASAARCRQLTTAPEGEARPLERLSQLFSDFFRHADLTTSDVAVTVYLANVLQRLRRRKAIEACLKGEPADDVAGTGRGSGSSTSAQQLLPAADCLQNTDGA